MSKILRTLGLEKLSIFDNQCVKPLFASLKQLNVFALDIRIAHVDTPTLREYPPGAHR
ncbi:MAG TPA: hypothetical protein VMX56_02755 [Anaerolineales bacterium]|nr:hypothetical protein [Anaerolineales bacterium]